MPSQQTRMIKLSIQLSPDQNAHLRMAASECHQSVSKFILESALACAEETLTNRYSFGLDAARWKAFMEALDAPEREMPRLERLLYQPTVFDPC